MKISLDVERTQPPTAPPARRKLMREGVVFAIAVAISLAGISSNDEVGIALAFFSLLFAGFYGISLTLRR